MGRRRRQENTILQRTNHSIEDLVENEGNAYLVTDLSKMKIRMSNNFNKAHKEMFKEKLIKFTEILMVVLQQNHRDFLCKIHSKNINKTQLRNLRRHRNN
jgi:hypothetical protein